MENERENERRQGHINVMNSPLGTGEEGHTVLTSLSHEEDAVLALLIGKDPSVIAEPRQQSASMPTDSMSTDSMMLEIFKDLETPNFVCLENKKQDPQKTMRMGGDIPSLPVSSNTSTTSDETEEDLMFKETEPCTQKLTDLLLTVLFAFSEFDGTDGSARKLWGALSEVDGVGILSREGYRSLVRHTPFSDIKQKERTQTGETSANTGEMASAVEDRIVFDGEERWFSIADMIVQSLFLLRKSNDDEEYGATSSETLLSTKEKRFHFRYISYFSKEEDVGPYSLEVWRQVYANGLSLLLPDLSACFSKGRNYQNKKKGRDYLTSWDSHDKAIPEKTVEMARDASFRAMAEWVSVPPVRVVKPSFSPAGNREGAASRTVYHTTTSREVDLTRERERERLGDGCVVEVSPAWKPFLRLYPFLEEILQEWGVTASSSTMEEERCPPSPHTLTAVLMIDTLYWVSSWYPMSKMWGEKSPLGMRVLWWTESPTLLWSLKKGFFPSVDFHELSRLWTYSRQNKQTTNGLHSEYLLEVDRMPQGSRAGAIPLSTGGPEQADLAFLPYCVSPASERVDREYHAHLTSASPPQYLGPADSLSVLRQYAETARGGVEKSHSSGAEMVEEDPKQSLVEESRVSLADIQEFLRHFYSLLRLESRNVMASEEYPSSSVEMKKEEEDVGKDPYALRRQEEEEEEKKQRENVLVLSHGVAVPTKWVQSLVSWIEACRKLPWSGLNYNVSAAETQRNVEEALKTEEGWKLFFPTPPGPIPTMQLPSFARACVEEPWGCPIRHRFFESMTRTGTEHAESSSLPPVEVLPLPVFSFLVAHFGIVGPKYTMPGVFFHRQRLLTLLEPPRILVEFNFERRVPENDTNPESNTSKESKGTFRMGSEELKVLCHREFVNATVEALPCTTIADALRGALYEAMDQGEMTVKEEVGWLQASITKSSPGEERSSCNDEENTPYRVTRELPFRRRAPVMGSMLNTDDKEDVTGPKERIFFVSFLNLELFPPPPPATGASVKPSSIPSFSTPSSSLPSPFGLPGTAGAPAFSSGAGALQAKGNEAGAERGGSRLPDSAILAEIDIYRERVGDVLDRLRVFCEATQRPWPLSEASEWETITLTVNAHYRAPFPVPEATSTSNGLHERNSQALLEVEEWRWNTKKNPGICGLYNLGNTCFMNSALQCLAHLDGFRTALLRTSFSSHFQEKISTARALQKVFLRIWSEGGNKVLSIEEFKKCMGTRRSRYAGFEQEDASEFITELLDCISEELNQCMTTKYREKTEADRSVAPRVLAELFWEDFLANQQSFVSDIFFAQSLCRFTCLTCHATSVVPENHCNIPLPVVEIERVEVSILVVLEILFTDEEEVSEGLRISACPSSQGVTEGREEEVRKAMGERGPERFLCLRQQVHFLDVLEESKDSGTPTDVVSSLDKESTGYHGFLSVPLLPSFKLRFVEDALVDLRTRIMTDPKVLLKISELSSTSVDRNNREVPLGSSSPGSSPSPSLGGSHAPSPLDATTTQRSTSGEHCEGTAVPSRVEFVQLWEHSESTGNSYIAYTRCWCDRGKGPTPLPTTTPMQKMLPSVPSAGCHDNVEQLPHHGSPPLYPFSPAMEEALPLATVHHRTSHQAPPPSASSSLPFSLPVWYCLAPLRQEEKEVELHSPITEELETVYIEDLGEAYLRAAATLASYSSASSMTSTTAEETEVEDHHRPPDAANGGDGEQTIDVVTEIYSNTEKEKEEEEEEGCHARQEVRPPPRRMEEMEMDTATKLANDFHGIGGTLGPRSSPPPGSHRSGGEEEAERQCRRRWWFTDAVRYRVEALRAHHLVPIPSSESRGERSGGGLHRSGTDGKEAGSSPSRGWRGIDWRTGVPIPLPPRTNGSATGGGLGGGRAAMGLGERPRNAAPPQEQEEDVAKKGTGSSRATSDEPGGTHDHTTTEIVGGMASRERQEEGCVCVLNLGWSFFSQTAPPTRPFSLAGGFRVREKRDLEGSSSTSTTFSSVLSREEGESSSLESSSWKREPALGAVVQRVEEGKRKEAIALESFFPNIDCGPPPAFHRSAERAQDLGVLEQDPSTSVFSTPREGVWERLEAGIHAEDGFLMEEERRAVAHTPSPFSSRCIRLETLQKHYNDLWAHTYFGYLENALLKGMIQEKGKGLGFPVLPQYFSIDFSMPSFSSNHPDSGITDSERIFSTGNTTEDSHTRVRSKGKKTTAPPLVIVIFYDATKYSLNKNKSIPVLELEENSTYTTSAIHRRASKYEHMPEKKTAAMEKVRRQELEWMKSQWTPFFLSLHETLHQPQLLFGNDAWYCPCCGTFRTATIQRSLFRLPPCLILSFSRFLQEGHRAKKNSKFMGFPDRLDLSSFLDAAADPSQPTVYVLKGVLYHAGTLDFGHYTAATYVSSIRKWVLFNDNSTMVLAGAPPRNDAYVLCYEIENQSGGSAH